MAIINYAPLSSYQDSSNKSQSQIKKETLKFYQDELYFTVIDPSTKEEKEYNFIAPSRNRHVFGVMIYDNIHDITQSPNYTYSDPEIIEYESIIIEEVGKLIWEAM